MEYNKNYAHHSMCHINFRFYFMITLDLFHFYTLPLTDLGDIPFYFNREKDLFQQAQSLTRRRPPEGLGPRTERCPLLHFVQPLYSFLFLLVTLFCFSMHMTDNASSQGAVEFI